MINKKVFKEKDFWLISFLILIITFLHYSNLMAEWEIHTFFRKLYYIPIILSCFRYRLKGGLISSIVVSILYAPHLFFYNDGINISLINQYLEIILFLTIGFITGRLEEQDYKKQKSLESKIVEITKLQNYTKNIVDSINSGVISINKDFIVKSTNREAEKILGIEDIEGINITEILRKKDVIDGLVQSKIQKIHLSQIKTEIIVENEERYLDLNISPLLDIMERVQGLVIIIQDKSKEKHLEAQAIRADRLSAVGELASGIAHEIRNPMGIIKTISQTLQEEESHEDIMEGLQIIVKEIDRANNVIQTLLNFARPDTNKKEEISINELLEDVILIINKYVQKQNIDIDIDLEKEIRIIGDKEKLKQVFINVILNGVQSILEGGEIKIKMEISNEGINISFKDTGCGIKKDNLKKVFNPFFTTKEKGTGLGLSVSNRIIQDHNGYMAIDSIVGNGTSVDIYLPMK